MGDLWTCAPTTMMCRLSASPLHAQTFPEKDPALSRLVHLGRPSELARQLDINHVASIKARNSRDGPPSPLRSHVVRSGANNNSSKDTIMAKASSEVQAHLYEASMLDPT